MLREFLKLLLWKLFSPHILYPLQLCIEVHNAFDKGMFQSFFVLFFVAIQTNFMLSAQQTELNFKF